MRTAELLIYSSHFKQTVGQESRRISHVGKKSRSISHGRTRNNTERKPRRSERLTMEGRTSIATDEHGKKTNHSEPEALIP